jgi:hypothetical protein
VLRRLATGLLATGVSVLAALILLEWGLRALGVGDDATTRPDPWVGWVHLPDHRAELQSEDPALGRRVHIRTNSLGLVDVPREARKPPGVRRVLLLGDSFVEAAQVPPDSAIGRCLERRLDERLGGGVEVWNCGVAGYSTAQELLYLRHVAVRFHPDLVVLLFLAGNDVADEVPELATSLRNRPFFRLDGDSLVLDRSFLRPDPPLVGWLRLHSRLFGWATTQARVVRLRLHQQAATRSAAGELPPLFEIYAQQPDPAWARAWALTERLIVEVSREAAHQGAGFLLVALPDGAQVHAQARAPSRPGWASWRARPGLSLEEPERRLQALAQAQGLDYLELLPAFRAEARRSGRPLHIGWAGHWNSAGHALAARLVAERIAARLATDTTGRVAR